MQHKLHLHIVKWMVFCVVGFSTIAIEYAITIPHLTIDRLHLKHFNSPKFCLIFCNPYSQNFLPPKFFTIIYGSYKVFKWHPLKTGYS